jgi:hypothetical protein
MAFYQETKTMRAAVIGTIMAWTGGLSSIPDGWIICDGSTLEAKRYPLLVQAIGDTYNTLASNLGGGFPNYTGNFVLPNLTDGRMLMDIEPDYFVGGNNPRPGVIDNDQDAADIITPFIGDNIDNGVPVVFSGANSLKTDVVFTLNVRSGYGGNISGNTIIDGSGEKTVYIGGRKLGHEHIRPHGHPGQYPSISFTDANRPGGGVVPWDYIQQRWGYRIWNNTGGDRVSFGGADELATIWEWTYRDTNIYLIDESSHGSFGNISGFGNGIAGRTVGSANAENPPINLSASQCRRYPIATALATWQHETLNPGDTINYGQGGNTLSVPSGLRNYYFDGDGGRYETLTSNTAGNFDDPNLVAHGHDPFVVTYDQSNLKPNSRIQATANIPLETTLDNAINVGALEINMNTQQPSLTCVYIIRAY